LADNSDIADKDSIGPLTSAFTTNRLTEFLRNRRFGTRRVVSSLGINPSGKGAKDNESEQDERYTMRLPGRLKTNLIKPKNIIKTIYSDRNETIEGRSILQKQLFGKFSSKHYLPFVDRTMPFGLLSMRVDSLANQITRYHNADAMTIGNTILIPSNKFNLTSSRGQALFVHELVHIAQRQIDHELERAPISSSKKSYLEEEAQSIEKMFLDYVRIRDYYQKFSGLSSTLHRTNLIMSKMRKLGSFGVYGPANILDRAIKGPTVKRNGVIADYRLSKDLSAPLTLKNSLPSHNFSYLQSSFYKNDSDISSNNKKHYLTEPVRLVTSQIPASAFTATNSVSENYMKAESSRPVDTSADINTDNPPIIQPTVTSTDLTGLADRVYDLILRKIKMEKDRRGLK
jgi:hypothetical protein